MYKMSKTASDVEAKRLVYEAFGLILNALEINENHWAVQKWAAIILNAKCSYEGVKALMKESYNIKHHMLVHLFYMSFQIFYSVVYQTNENF